MRKATAALGAAMMVVLAAAPAWAHVTANPNEGPAGGFFKTEFRVGHGCDGEPTTEITVQIPGGVTSVHPQVKPGWDITTEAGELDEPVEMEGETVTEGVRSITWTATGEGLPDAFMDEFGVSMRLPEQADDDVLWFPFVQKCPGGGEHRWVTIPESVEAWGEVDEPAPFVTLAAAEGGHGGATDAEDGDASELDDTASTGDQAPASDDSDAGVLLGSIGIGLGALALVLTLLRGRSG